MDAADLSAPVVVRLALALLRAMSDPATDPADVLEALAPLVRLLVAQDGGAEDLRCLVLYVAVSRRGIDVPALSRRVKRVVGPEAAEVVMSTAQELIDQGIEKGIEKGTQALRRVLSRQLTQRFGALSSEVAARIEAARTTELERWTGRVLGAKRVADVFARRAASPRPARRRKRGAGEP